MTKLLIATNNLGKVAEYKDILAHLPLEITWPAKEGIDLDPEETGSTFEENAIIKARAFAQINSDILVMADDSGLEVDALNGEPGIYSARYGNTTRGNYISRCQIILDKLAAKNISWEERTARFKCVIALINRTDLIGTVQGTVDGFISYEPKGVSGFGYDPIFFLPQFNKTVGEISSADKHSISHRGRAGKAVILLIKNLLG